MAAVEQTQQATEYNVLERVELTDRAEAHAWLLVATVSARDATQAIKQHLDGKAEIDSQFVATPARSWKPVAVKTKIALDFGDPS